MLFQKTHLKMQAQCKQLLQEFCKELQRALLIAAGLSPFSKVWETFFNESLNSTLAVTILSLSSRERSVYLFQATSSTSLSGALPTLLARIVPVTSKHGPSETVCCLAIQEKESLSENNYYRHFFENWQVFSFPHNCISN